MTALRYNKAGSMFASGSKDNDVILWDVVGETGLFRLRGHRDQVSVWLVLQFHHLFLAVGYFSLCFLFDTTRLFVSGVGDRSCILG